MTFRRTDGSPLADRLPFAIVDAADIVVDADRAGVPYISAPERDEPGVCKWFGVDIDDPEICLVSPSTSSSVYGSIPSF